jgi:hypothetical protein
VSVLTMLAGVVVASAALAAPTDPPCPPDGEPYTAMAGYACSLAAWHRSTQPDVTPAQPPSCQGETDG